MSAVDQASSPAAVEENRYPLAQRIGAAIFEAANVAGGMLSLLIQIIREIVRPPYYPRLILDQIYIIGIQSFLLVAVTGLATGSVMALQFGYGLQRFGGTLYVPKIVSLSILREMGPVFASLLVCGRIGSGIAAEVASMKVSQQIDAIRALGTSPIKRIVIPRVVASMIALPLLTIFANYIGLLSAMAVCAAYLNINTEFFVAKCFETLRIYDVTTGMLKTSVFAFFISITACWKGLNTSGGTRGVGETTTWVVVAASIFIMVSDVLMTQLFIYFVYPRY